MCCWGLYYKYYGTCFYDNVQRLLIVIFSYEWINFRIYEIWIFSNRIFYEKLKLKLGNKKIECIQIYFISIMIDISTYIYIINPNNTICLNKLIKVFSKNWSKFYFDDKYNIFFILIWVDWSYTMALLIRVYCEGMHIWPFSSSLYSSPFSSYYLHNLQNSSRLELILHERLKNDGWKHGRMICGSFMDGTIWIVLRMFSG